MRSRIRSRARALREPFGKAGLTVAIIALVFAMVGGAFAAAGLNGKQKKQVKKIAKKFAGKPGPAGAQGAPGAPGANGTNGSDGSNGTPGANGKSVVATDIIEGEEACNELGGAEFTVGSGTPTYACNGAEGPQGDTGDTGPTGPAGPITGELPSGVTIRGVWGVAQELGAGSQTMAPVNFGLSLASPLPEANAHYIKKNVTPPTGCTGGTAAAPKADPGHLCIYTTEEENVFSASLISPSPEPKSGALLMIGLEPLGLARGSWAVTAP